MSAVGDILIIHESKSIVTSFGKGYVRSAFFGNAIFLPDPYAFSTKVTVYSTGKLHSGIYSNLKSLTNISSPFASMVSFTF